MQLWNWCRRFVLISLGADWHVVWIRLAFSFGKSLMLYLFCSHFRIGQRKKRMAIRGMKEFLPKKRWVSKPPLGRKNRFIIEALDPFCLKASIQNPCDGSDPNHPNDFFYGINQQESSQTTLGNFELKNSWSGRSLEVNSVTLW